MYKRLFWFVVMTFLMLSCTEPSDKIMTIGEIEFEVEDNPLRKFDFILIKDSSQVVKPSKEGIYWNCDGSLITYCRLGIINHVKEIYFLDYSCVEHYGVSAIHSKAKILPQLRYCNASWSIQRTLKYGDTLFTNFKVCSEKNAPVTFEWILPLFKDQKKYGERFSDFAIKRDYNEVSDTLKLVSQTFYL
ncbi:MAG: hypothetical protein ACO1N0_09080 [Fluviicola sp.]